MIHIMSAESRKTFDLYNIFRNKDVKVVLYSNKKLLIRLILMIIYLKKVYSYSDLSKLYEGRILAVEEADISFIYDNDLDQYSDTPSQKVFENMRDKFELVSLLEDVGLNYPITRRLEQASPADFEGSVFLKPRWGMGAEGVARYESFNALKSDIAKKSLKNFIVQKAINSNSNIVSACMFCRNGKILSYYSHKRLVTFPEGDGVSVISKSFTSSVILDISQKLVTKTSFSGFIMIEFLYDTERQAYYVIEINPRPWGSILLSEICESNLIESYLTYESQVVEVKECFIKWPFPHLFLRLLRGHNDFSKYNDAKSGYINFTYSGIWRTTLFIMFYSLNFAKIYKKLWP